MKYFLTLVFSLSFVLQYSAKAQEILLLKTSGKVVVGDTSQINTPDGYNLFVQNGILTERVKVAIKGTGEWSDDAWEHTPDLKEVQSSIENNRHLPSMPSADYLVENGYELQKMDAKLLAQIEWLWQHMITIKEENELLKKELESLKSSKQ